MAPAVDPTSTNGHPHVHDIHDSYAGNGYSDRAYETADVSVYEILSSRNTRPNDTTPRNNQRDELQSESSDTKTNQTMCIRNRELLLTNFINLAPQGNS